VRCCLRRQRCNDNHVDNYISTSGAGTWASTASGAVSLPSIVYKISNRHLRPCAFTCAPVGGNANLALYQCRRPAVRLPVLFTIPALRRCKHGNHFAVSTIVYMTRLGFCSRIAPVTSRNAQRRLPEPRLGKSLAMSGHGPFDCQPPSKRCLTKRS
jgi:hypothetical protein